MEDGAVVGFDIDATVELTWSGTQYGDIVYSGTLMVTPEGSFDLEVGDVSDAAQAGDDFANGIFNTAARWDFSGGVVLP